MLFTPKRPTLSSFGNTGSPEVQVRPRMARRLSMLTLGADSTVVPKSILCLIVGLIACLQTGCGQGPKKQASAPPTVVFLGDSITYNWKVFYPALWQQHPEWTNAGITGQNSNQLLARFQSDVVAAHPQIVAILTGTNDVYPGWLGPCVTSEVPAVFLNKINTCENLKSMVAMAQAAKINVILATIPPWETEPITIGDTAWNADHSPGRYVNIAEWNAWVVQFGGENGIPVVDYHSALAAPDDLHYVPANTVDGVHPTTVGFLLMTPLIEAAIVKSASTANSKTFDMPAEELYLLKPPTQER